MNHHALPGRDYLAVARLLAGAGNRIEARLLELADGPLARWLLEQLSAAPRG